MPSVMYRIRVAPPADAVEPKHSGEFSEVQEFMRHPGAYAVDASPGLFEFCVQYLRRTVRIIEQVARLSIRDGVRELVMRPDEYATALDQYGHAISNELHLRREDVDQLTAESAFVERLQQGV